MLTVFGLNGCFRRYHIGLTRQVTQYFESRSELQTLLEQIFSGTTPDHPSEDALERELEQISAEIVQVKEDFEKHRLAKQEFKEIRRYVDIWNDAIEKQIASNAKDVTKSFKKFVPFRGPKPPSYTKIADAHMVNARTFVPTLEDIGLLSDIKMDTIADTSSELIIYTAKFKDSYNSLSHALEVLHKRSRVLKRKKYQVMEELFDERCKIFSDELQAHYRSIGERLAGGSGSASADNMATGGGSAMHRQHVESNLNAYSTGNSGTLGHNSQEQLLDAEELPSYFQHLANTTLHRRTGSLGSPAHSSSASSSLSLNSPLQIATVDSPPDYVRTELSSGEIGVPGGGGGGRPAEEDEDALFRAYHQRYDTRQRQASDPPTTRSGVAAAAAEAAAVLDTPPGYDETRYHSVVDPTRAH
ncbi:hypothetical protein BGZ67_006245 [Mortierella alpina]|nr:hypothetical protein BGZ67_006245 [Mortierella alpina]